MSLFSRSKKEFNIVMFLLLMLQIEGCAKEPILPIGKVPAIQHPVDGIRIAWDFRSLTKIAPLDGRSGYFGYARMVQLFDGRLACVYETSGNIELVFSTDFGSSWSIEPKIIGFRKDRRDGMPVPMIVT